jgi:hypothetical protein
MHPIEESQLTSVNGTQVTNLFEPLGPDKGSILKATNSSNFSAAGLKSFHIISKFWGDELDTENASDSTSEPVADSEKIDFLELHPVAQKYLEAGSTVKSMKKAKKT